MFCVVSAIAWTEKVFSTDNLGFGVDSCHCLNLRNFLSDHQLLKQSGFPRGPDLSSRQSHGL